MRCTGEITHTGRTLGNHPEITISLDGCTMQEVIKLSELGRLTVEIEKYRKKRSLDANAYYWVLISRICAITGDSKNRTHNMMLDRYGVMDYMPDGSMIPFCIRDDIDHLEFPFPHLKPTQKTLSKGGMLYRWYYQIKGSSEYDSSEMSVLIDGVISECREMGIETLPPAEMERMMKAYAQKHDRKAAV